MPIIFDDIAVACATAEIAEGAAVAEVAEGAAVAEVAEGAAVAEVAEGAAVAEVAEGAAVAEVAEGAAVAEVAEGAAVAEVAEGAAVAEVAEGAAVAEVAEGAAVADGAAITEIPEGAENASQGAKVLGDGVSGIIKDDIKSTEISCHTNIDAPEPLGDGQGENTLRFNNQSDTIENSTSRNTPVESINTNNELSDSIKDCNSSDNNIEPNDSSKSDLENSSVAEQSEIKKTGGSYGELKAEGWGWSSEPPKEVHHMPADSSSYLERNEGPAVVMDYEDHKQTASCGSSREAKEYRAIQKDLIDQGKFKEALQMDLDDLHEKFGEKYNNEIMQMQGYVDVLEKNGKI